MKKEQYQFSYSVFDSIAMLDEPDAALLQQARELTGKSYAPYSHFNVACVAKLVNGETVSGTNQENASFPVGICAERALLAAAGTLFPGEPIETIAITYNPEDGKSNKPVSPCGMCRQALIEYENRVHHPIKLILSGMEGTVFVIDSAKHLLPLAFGEDNLK